ncbi:MAG: Hsp20/alpha crystallin family protein [Cyanobacteria bacterium SZAS LIN-2]|nr:Hsp20/alpha crystallin family protein [Cyanobacteria bacterium SZAS LIN-3]MBS1994763.1 Hsp20/alpha crystallin family protein [Cyanobacteria bacterium SZAS LIN-2]
MRTNKKILIASSCALLLGFSCGFVSNKLLEHNAARASESVPIKVTQNLGEACPFNSVSLPTFWMPHLVSFFDPFIFPELDFHLPSFPEPSMNISRMRSSSNDKEYTLSTDLPGMSDKDVKVDVSNNILTIKAEKKESKTDNGKSNSFSEQSISQSMSLPDNLDTKNVKAEMNNGVLTVTIPKKSVQLSARQGGGGL